MIKHPQGVNILPIYTIFFINQFTSVTIVNAASSPYINGYETSKDRGLCAGEISEGTIQGFRGAGSYEKLQVKKEGRSCAVFPWIGAVAC